MAENEEIKPTTSAASEEIPLSEEAIEAQDENISPKEEAKRQEYIEEFEKYIFKDVKNITFGILSPKLIKKVLQSKTPNISYT